MAVPIRVVETGEYPAKNWKSWRGSDDRFEEQNPSQAGAAESRRRIASLRLQGPRRAIMESSRPPQPVRALSSAAGAHHRVRARPDSERTHVRLSQPLGKAGQFSPHFLFNYVDAVCSGACEGAALVESVLGAAFLTGAFFLAAALRAGAFTAAFLAGAFLGAGAAFLAVADFALAASARFRAHRFLVAAMILFNPSSLIRRFGGDALAGAGVDGCDCPRNLAHLAFCAKAIFRRAPALILLRFGEAVSEVAAGVPPPDSMDRSSAMRVSISRFWCSNPAIAAVMISEVSFCGMRNVRGNLKHFLHATPVGVAAAGHFPGINEREARAACCG